MIGNDPYYYPVWRLVACSDPRMWYNTALAVPVLGRALLNDKTITDKVCESLLVVDRCSSRLAGQYHAVTFPSLYISRPWGSTKYFHNYGRLDKESGPALIVDKGFESKITFWYNRGRLGRYTEGAEDTEDTEPVINAEIRTNHFLHVQIFYSAGRLTKVIMSKSYSYAVANDDSYLFVIDCGEEYQKINVYRISRFGEPGPGAFYQAPGTYDYPRETDELRAAVEAIVATAESPMIVGFDVLSLMFERLYSDYLI